MRTELGLFILSLMLAGCTPTPDGTPRDIGSDDEVATRKTAPAPCERVVLGEPCSRGDRCSLPCDDPCRACIAYLCGDGKWESLEGHPGDCFDCGDLRCEVGAAFCDRTGDEPSCQDLPRACLERPSCECPGLPEGECDSARPGALTLSRAP